MINFEINKLFLWYQENHRDLPWRNTTNPYIVWLSEIILQQTRVDQGMPYFNRFIETYPTVIELANAPLDEVYKLWEGLGYYSRAKNLHAAAQYVANELDGVFPNNYKGLLQLKGVGDYTASAIASFCYGEKTPVLDGNVYRVISRIYNIEEPINTPKAVKLFKSILNEIISQDDPATFNQAMMEFGALHCTPKKPKCEACPFAANCLGLEKNNVENLPVKKKAAKSKNRYFNYLVMIEGNQVLVKKREGKDIWENLYEFPLIESKEAFDNEQLKNITFTKISPSYKQVLSHQNIYAKFYLVNQKNAKVEGTKVSFNELKDLGVHGLMKKFLLETDWLLY